jgi:hypothetical protein
VKGMPRMSEVKRFLRARKVELAGL